MLNPLVVIHLAFAINSCSMLADLMLFVKALILWVNLLRRRVKYPAYIFLFLFVLNTVYI